MAYTLTDDEFLEEMQQVSNEQKETELSIPIIGPHRREELKPKKVKFTDEFDFAQNVIMYDIVQDYFGAFFTPYNSGIVEPGDPIDLDKLRVVIPKIVTRKKISNRKKKEKYYCCKDYENQLQEPGTIIVGDYISNDIPFVNYSPNMFGRE